MELSDLIEICKAWDHMGWAVQSQAEAVVGGKALGEQNPNALEMVQEWLDLVYVKAEEAGDEGLRLQAEEMPGRIQGYLAGEVAAA